jgi:hypothetical protein
MGNVDLHYGEKYRETMHLTGLLTWYWTWSILFFERKHADDLEDQWQ